MCVQKLIEWTDPIQDIQVSPLSKKLVSLTLTQCPYLLSHSWLYNLHQYENFGNKFDSYQPWLDNFQRQTIVESIAFNIVPHNRNFAKISEVWVKCLLPASQGVPEIVEVAEISLAEAEINPLPLSVTVELLNTTDQLQVMCITPWIFVLGMNRVMIVWIQRSCLVPTEIKWHIHVSMHNFFIAPWIFF